jgi:hypothetical protein
MVGKALQSLGQASVRTEAEYPHSRLAIAFDVIGDFI